MKHLLPAAAALAAPALLVGLGARPAAAVVMVEDVITETNTFGTWLQSITSAANTAKSVVNEGVMIGHQVTQIRHLLDTLDSVRHGNLYAVRTLVPELASLGLVNPYDGDVRSMQQLLNGATDVAAWAGNLSGLAQGYRQGWHTYVPTARDYAGAYINAGAAAASAQAVAGAKLVEGAGERSRHLDTLNRTAGTTADIKDATDLVARAAIENGIATQQVAQGVGLLVQQQARVERREVQDRMMGRASADTLARSARLAYAQAQTGEVSLFVGPHGRPVAFSTPAPSPSGEAPLRPSGGAAVSPVSATAVGAPYSGDGTAVATMAANLGDGTVTEAARFGVSAEAVAAVCMAESGCRPIGAHGATSTAAGPFGYTSGTVARNAPQAGYDPAVARADGTAQAGVTASDLSRYARTLQGAGIATPTVLDGYGFHMFGPGEGVALASASPDTRLGDALQYTSAATLAANRLSPNTTVGQWRQSVAGRMGGAANAPILVAPVVKS